ncbi:hypothetical protein QO209_31080 [Pseudomonas citronellolis]|uniref:hypothetical protein n=1 Tax=Pseudomonas citronellolis TaxID=53408 RepID=UPI00264A3F8C|nr:hypothetical protein [Pseudomonas citronellolis]MDN6876910.1 hypothetical protein [Pseudomonas citronellolis]
MPNYKAAFESASLDLSAIMSLLGFTSYPGVDQVLRAITELILNKAEAQALRDQVKALQSDANSYQSGYDEGRRMGTKHRQDEVEQLTREVAALRARVVVVPERKNRATTIAGLSYDRGWNACLDELARLNGKVVSEGLLLRITAEPAGGAVYDAIAELRALLGEGKEHE